MAKNMKPYEIPLEPGLADDVLNMPLPDEPAVPQAPARTIKERVRRAIQAVDEANDYLKFSPLARLTADTLMRQLKKRGAATLHVRPDGAVVLQVSYMEEKPRDIPTVHKAQRQSEIPLLAELRERASALGINISDLGRARKAIYARIKEAEEVPAPPRPPPPPAPEPPMPHGLTEVDLEDLL